MRMLAWINLLSPDGWATQFLHASGSSGCSSARLALRSGGWLDGQPSTVIIALAYGYIPFLILPLFAALDRIDQRQIEAARDLGASPLERVPARDAAAVACPASSPASVLIALPMFGDYYTPDLVSPRPKTNMIGNQIDQLTRQGSEKVVGAVADAAARARCCSC